MVKRSNAVLISAVFLIVVLVIVPVFVSFYQTLRSLGTQYLKQCPTAWQPERPGQNITQLQTLAAMTANPGTSAKICAEYISGISSSVTSSLNASIYFENNMSIVPSRLIGIAVQPALLKVHGMRGFGPSPVAYAVFTLNFSTSAQGYYMLYLGGFCSGMPLAVGYSRINYTDFANGWQQRKQCTLDGFVGSYFSVNNLGVAYSYVPLSAQ